jgi:uncharacterized protein with PQ loop repeat
MNAVLVEAIGFLAGGFVTSAAMPRVIDIIRDHDAARGESLARNAMLVTGNLIWVVYGVASSTLAIVVMCAITASLNATILFATFRARRRKPT